MSTLKLLLDENLSPSLLRRLAEDGVVAEHIVYVGKSGLSDPELWTFALARDAVVVTINARDFLSLAAKSEVHAGLIVLRSQGLDRAAQWAWLEPVVQHLSDTGEQLVNKAVVVVGPGKFTIADLPQPK